MPGWGVPGRGGGHFSGLWRAGCLENPWQNKQEAPVLDYRKTLLYLIPFHPVTGDLCIQIANGDKQFRGDLEDKRFKATGELLFCSCMVHGKCMYYRDACEMDLSKGS